LDIFPCAGKTLRRIKTGGFALTSCFRLLSACFASGLIGLAAPATAASLEARFDGGGLVSRPLDPLAVEVSSLREGEPWSWTVDLRPEAELSVSITTHEPLAAGAFTPSVAIEAPTFSHFEFDNLGIHLDGARGAPWSASDGARFLPGTLGTLRLARDGAGVVFSFEAAPEMEAGQTVGFGVFPPVESGTGAAPHVPLPSAFLLLATGAGGLGVLRALRRA
jgi:hypothetical protein